MKTLKKVISIVVIMFFILINCFSFVQANKINTTIIKVGYVNHYGIYSTSDNKSGYLFDYLNEIAKYTGWQYEFIEVEWDQGLQMLEDGQLDLFGPMQKTSEREQKYTFSERSLGNEYGALYISKDRKDIYYDNPASYDGLTVAIPPKTYYEDILKQYCLNNNIEMNLVYTDASQLANGLKNKQYDMVLGLSTLDIENSVLAAKIGSEPFYMATSKDNVSLAKQMDDVLSKIQGNDSYFEANLFNTHYANKAFNSYAFTKEEMDFIKKHKTLRIVCNADWLPITYYNEDTKKIEGIGIDLLSALEQQLDIHFELEVSHDLDDATRKIENNEVDLMFGFIKYDLAKMKYSNAIMNTPLVIVGRKEIANNANKQIGYYRASETVSQELKKQYPNFNFVQYKSIQALIDALNDGKEQYVMFNYYASEEIKWRNPNETYNISVTDINFAIDMGASIHNDPLLLDVINKGIQRLSSEQISTIVYDNNVARSDKYVTNRFLSEHRETLFIGGFSMFIIVLLVIIFLNNRKKHALQKMAYFDSLTNIYTIEKFKIDAKTILAKAHANEYVLLCLDINNFKYINNTFGYESGDIILKEVVKHIRSFHPIEGNKHNYLFARISSDHFVILITQNNLDALLTHLKTISNNPIYINEMLSIPNVHFSIGYYTIDSLSEELNILLDKANYARKIGKVYHDHNIKSYTTQMHEAILWEKEVIMHMEQSLNNKEFTAYFQPKYDFKNEQLVGAEALARWNHSTKGMIPPIKFIPIFEKNGFIKKLDFFILEETCRFLAYCKQQNLPLVPISVNFSRVQLQDENLKEHVIAIVDKYEVDHALIEIELTENVLLEDPLSIIGVMSQIRNVGFTISIDDFGSEYSSLRLISQLPIDVLKIDKTFVDHCFDNDKGIIIIQKIIELAKVISLQTVAEGVETKQQAQLLKDMGCDIAQGYYYGKPLEKSEFLVLLKKKSL